MWYSHPHKVHIRPFQIGWSLKVLYRRMFPPKQPNLKKESTPSGGNITLYGYLPSDRMRNFTFSTNDMRNIIPQSLLPPSKEIWFTSVAMTVAFHIAIRNFTSLLLMLRHKMQIDQSLIERISWGKLKDMYRNCFFL